MTTCSPGTETCVPTLRAPCVVHPSTSSSSSPQTTPRNSQRSGSYRPYPTPMSPAQRASKCWGWQHHHLAAVAAMPAWPSTGPAPCLGRRGTGLRCGTASLGTTAGAAPTACCQCCCSSKCSSLMRTCAMPVRAPTPSKPSPPPKPSPAHTAHTREPHQPKPTPHSLHSSSWQQQPACAVR